MRVIGLIFRGVALLVLIVVVVAVAGIGGVIWATLPRGDMDAQIPGLSAPVDVTIDPDGIPRIRAANSLDAAAALGFLHARERLFQMDLMRRAASGELSEIAGPAALGIDRLMRTLGLRRSAEADLAAMKPEVRAILDAYASGVNAWIAKRGRLSSEEFAVLGTPRPWTALDSLLWGKTMALYLSGNWRAELARFNLHSRLPAETIEALWPSTEGGEGHPAAALTPPATPDERAVLRQLASALPTFPDPFTLPAEESNEWAVDGAHSVTGAPLLAGDPHLGFSFPAIWYLARIDTPDGVLAGATAPGVPFLVLGHNSHIAWTFTTTGTDTQDLFIETPVGTDSYQTPSGPEKFMVRQERIRVRGQPDELWTVRETRHGPLISDLTNPGGPMLALAASNLMPGDTAAAGLMALNQATDVASAGQAAAAITTPNQNLLVADKTGIGLFVTGRVPIRRAGNGSRPEPGASGDYDWIGWASGDALPHYVNPASGRLVNANERVAPQDYGVYLGRDWFGDERARRIRAMLDKQPTHTLDEFRRMQLDTVSASAQDLLPRLLKTAPADDISKTALGLLGTWNASMSRDQPQPLIFNAWMRAVYDAMLTDVDINGRAGRAAAAPWMELIPSVLLHGGPDEVKWFCRGDCDKLLSDALAQSLAGVVPRFGPDPSSWRWGTAHEAVFSHPILRMIPLLGPLTDIHIPSPGDDTTVDRGGLAPEGFTSVHGPAYRGVYDLADLDRSRFVVTPGQSGHIFSRLARNFLKRWRDGDTVTIGPTPDRVDVTIKLTPSGHE